MRWPFDPLDPFRYGLVMCDPPWQFQLRSERGEEKAPQAHYRCMSIADVKALPVGDLAHPDGCVLWLWATHPMLREAFAVMDAWGFRFVTSGVWTKRNPATGKLGFGTGYALRSASEPFLLGAIGSPSYARNVRTVIEAARREHSRKPDEAYAAARQLAIDATRRADLFSRERREGWECWGDEVEKFSTELDKHSGQFSKSANALN